MPILLIIKNLLSPTRFFTKLSYGQIIPIPDFVTRGKKINLTQYPLNSDERVILKQLKKDGFAIFPNCFESESDNMLKLFSIDINRNSPDATYHDFLVSTPDNSCLSVVLNLSILKIFAHYWKRQPYLRSAPSIKDTYSNYNSLHSREKFKEPGKFQTNWHFDTANQLQFHLLLKDVTQDDSHMVIAKNGHRVHRVSLRQDDYFYSDEYINDNFEIVPMIGKKGTLYIFDSNTPHKAIIRKNTRRIMLQGLFTPGNSMLKYVYPENDDLILKIEDSSLRKLNLLQLEAIRFCLKKSN